MLALVLLRQKIVKLKTCWLLNCLILRHNLRERGFEIEKDDLLIINLLDFKGTCLKRGFEISDLS